MTNELPSDPNLDRVEKDLSAYAPRPPRIDRDRLMFEAGRAAALADIAPAAPSALRNPHWLWPISTVAMSALSLGLALALVVRPMPQKRIISASEPDAKRSPTTEVVAQSAAGQPPTAVNDSAADLPTISLASLPENHLLRLRQLALTEGVDALKPPAEGGSSRLSPPPTRGELMRMMTLPRATSQPQTFPFFRWPVWLTPESTM